MEPLTLHVSAAPGLQSASQPYRGLPVQSDEALVELARDGDEQATEELLVRYRFLAARNGRSYFLPGAEREDLVQEGMIGLMKAIRDFRPGRGPSFRGFAELCVNRQVITAVKTATRHKHAALNQYRSLDQPTGPDGDEPTLSERLPGALSPEAQIWDGHEDQRSLLEQAGRFLSSYELDVLRHYCQGLSYSEIGQRLGKSVKSIDNAVFKVKLKLRRRAEAQAGEVPWARPGSDRAAGRGARSIEPPLRLSGTRARLGGRLD